MKQVINQYLLLTGWFLSVLEGMDDKDGSKTVYPDGNGLEWITEHLITGGYRNLLRLDIYVTTYKHPKKFFDESKPPPNAIAFNKDAAYPPLSASLEQW